MKSFYLTDAGKVRDHNEDSVLIVHNSDGDTLMAIADGMGGHSAGEVASSIAITHLSREFNENFHNMSKMDAVNFLRDSVNEINEQLQEKVYPSKSRPIFQDSEESVGTYYLYIVKDNDSYSSVAKRYDIDEKIIRDYNQDKVLEAGNVLIIPYVP